MFSNHLIDKATKAIKSLHSLGHYVCLAESCTGGMFGALLTSIPGASGAFCRSYVTYSNLAKEEMIDVSPDILENYGAVSRETAEAMAKGVVESSNCDFAISVTGIAGPDGGSADKPVGLVYIGLAEKTSLSVKVKKCQFDGDRESVRLQAIETGLDMLLDTLKPYL